MVQLVVLAGSFVLIGLLLMLVSRRRGPLPPLPATEPFAPEHLKQQLRAAMQSLPWQRLAPLPRERRALPLLRRLLRSHVHLASLTFLQERSREMYFTLLSLRKGPCPRLPATSAGTPRMLALCRRYLALGGSMDASHLLDFLSACQDSGALTLHERLHLPLCMGTALAEQLTTVLRHLLLASAENRQGIRLASRLSRARRPMELLNSQHLSLTASQAMVFHLQERHEAALLAALEERMRQADYSLLRLAQEHAAQQAMLTDHLARILGDLQALRKLDWPALLEPADPLHQLFEKDPTGTYPAMDTESRALYRQRAAALARLFSVEETRLAKDILVLCGAADPDGLRDHVGWYLLEYQGVRALQRHLHVHRGTLRLLLEHHAPWLHRAALAIFALASGLIFLHSGHPLWMLPFFLGASSGLAHFLLGALLHRLFPGHPLPRMQVNHVTEESRTLIVLPVVLGDHTQAVPAARRLLLARKAFPEGAVDCLLLADYSPCLTQTSSQDQNILMAARMAIGSVNGDGGQFLYMHRRRAWDASLRAYAGHGGLAGAMASLNQLIVHGQCDDEFDEATLPPAALHRRYACVITLEGDVTPAPDALHYMLGALSHPLNQRRHTAEGVRGMSMVRPRLEKDPAALRSRVGLWVDHQHTHACLYHPYSLVEATENWPLPHPFLAGELSGCGQDASARFFSGAHRSVSVWLDGIYHRYRRAWQLVPWLLSHVKTPSGVRRNPLSSHSKYNLRQELRRAVLPVCSLLLLLYALLCRSLPLLLFALLAPEWPLTPPGGFLTRLSGLPLRAVIHADAMLDAAWHALSPKHSRPGWLPSFAWDPAACSVWETWSQGLAAIAFAVAALALRPLSLAGLFLAACFAVFPLLHPWLDAPLRPQFRPTPDMENFLMEVAQATWRFFEETVTGSTHFLPPESLQLKPLHGAGATTSTRAIGSYLLSCLATRELGLIDTETMCQRVAQTMTTLENLPLWHGLPYERYTTETLSIADPAFVSSSDCGFFCACLITLAQGLRSYLPEIPDTYANLSHKVDSFARHMELRRLFDPQAGLFSTGYHAATETLDAAHHELFASEALLLSFVAVMRRQVPFSHLAKLRRPLVRLGHGVAHLSQHGTASEYLLPMLFLPASPHTALDRTLRTIIRLQRRSGVEGMFGLSESSCWQLDPHLNYQRRIFGVAEAALSPSPAKRVIAPYATALCLPFAPEEACDSLARLRSRGMLARLGFFESIDFDPVHLPEGSGEAVVHSHVAHHQGLLLCALCNALTGNILAAHFTAVPQSAAFLPLLHHRAGSAMALPVRYLHPEATVTREPSFRRGAQPLAAPLDAHIIGSPEATLLISAQGTGLMRSRDVNLTRFTGDPTQVEGIQFYLNDGLDTWRLTDPALPGDTTFAEGSARFIRVCGQLQATLTAMTDPVQGSFLHIIEVANLTGHHRTFDIASCLVPELSGRACETARPEERVLTLAFRPASTGDHPLTLCHAISTHEPLLALAAQTDLTAFQGATPHHPAGLDAPLQDGLIGAPDNPCASFRARLKLGPRGRAAVIFVTRLMARGESFSLDALAPRLSEAASMQSLSALLSRTMTDSLSISQPRAAELSRLFGPLMWHAQPHQGAITPLSQPAAALHGLGLEAELPLLLLIVHSDGCATLLRDACDATQWLHLLGLPAQLCVLCQGDDAAQARSAAWSLLRNHPATLLTASELPEGLRETLEAAARVILYEGSGTITAQLEATSLRLPIPAPVKAATDAPAHPPEELRFDNGAGGFQPGTDDYIIHSSSGGSWRNQLVEGSFSTNCDERGLGESALGGATIVTSAENVFLSDDSHVFSPTPQPLGQGLSHRITLSPGVTSWHSLGHGLDMTLTAATIGGATTGCRTLRLKNTTSRERRFTLTITSRFLMGAASATQAFTCLTPVKGGVVAASPEVDFYGFLALAEGPCESLAVSPLAFEGFGPVPNLDAPGDEAGTLALLRLSLAIPAEGATSVTWLAGACRHMDEIEQLLARLRKHGASSIYRQVRQAWGQRLGPLTISTPVDSLNLLMNRVLPWQVHTVPASLWNATALIHTDPEATLALLQSDNTLPEDGTQLLLPYSIALYILRTGRKDVLTQPLYARCMQALTSIHLGQQGLPLRDGRESVPLALFFSSVLHSFAPYAQADDRVDIHTVRDRLLESLERAAPVVEQAWQKLFTSRHLTADAPTLWMLSALFDLHQPGRAWGLLQALNPIHRGGFPLNDSPCAGFLYATVLEKLLGFEKRGDQVRLRPMVPADWDSFTITLQWGSATWRFHAEANEPFLTCDGEGIPSGWVTLADDGRIHEVRTPLRQG